MPKVNLSAVTITELVDHLEGQKRRIDEQLLELRGVLGVREVGNGTLAVSATGTSSVAVKRRISVAGRKRMAAAQQARWAALKGAKTVAPTPAAVPAKPKRTLSAAGRKRIVAALKNAGPIKKPPRLPARSRKP